MPSTVCGIWEKVDGKLECEYSNVKIKREDCFGECDCRICAGARAINSVTHYSISSFNRPFIVKRLIDEGKWTRGEIYDLVKSLDEYTRK